MELGGVSVPGGNARTDGAYLLKDLSAFETQLGGLTAFVMVSDGTGDGPGSDIVAQLAVKAADTYLGSVLRGIATGQAPVVEPVAMLKAIVAQANTAVINEADAVSGTDAGATFVGAFLSADRTWFGQVGGGKAYLLRDDDARELVVEARSAEEDSLAEAIPVSALLAEPPFAQEADAEISIADSLEPAPDEAASGPAAAEATFADDTQTLIRLPEIVPAAAVQAPAPTELGHAGVRVDVGSADLDDGDVVVLLGRQASEALGDADIRGITCAACDARVAASELAQAAAKVSPERSVTVAIWSSDSSLFTPVPPPEVAISPVVLAANSDTSGGSRAERIFLWVMSGLIVAEILAVVAMALLSKTSSAPRPVSTAAPSGIETTAAPGTQAAVAASATQEATTIAPPAEQPEYPKTLDVPRNVPGGLWLRKKATTQGGSNLVIQLKPGAEVQAVDIEKVEDANGKSQEFYVFKVSGLDSDQVVETGSYAWPPSKSIKTVYAFAKSFESSQ